MNKQLEDLKAAALAATPGPWISGDDSWSDGDNANITTEERNEMGIIDIAQINGGGSESDLDGSFRTEQQANARYIAAAHPAAVLVMIAELEGAQQRIAELESCNRLGYTRRIEQENAELKAKLSTPVRLPQCRSVLFRGDFSGDYRSQMAFEADDVMAAIRAAGFKVEGDA